MTQKNKVPDFNKLAQQLKREARVIAGTESVKFFKDCFRKKGFTDTSFKEWPKSDSPLKGKSLMVNTTHLSDSIRKKYDTEERIVIESEAIYSQLHNEGGTITVTRALKAHFWKLFYEFSEGVTVKKNNAASLSKKNVSLGKKAMYCRAIALKPVGSKIKMPPRQFMGKSATLMLKIDDYWRDKIDLVFKQHLND